MLSANLVSSPRGRCPVVVIDDDDGTGGKMSTAELRRDDMCAKERGVACSVCTLINDPGALVCEICQQPLTSSPQTNYAPTGFHAGKRLLQTVEECSSSRATMLERDASLAAALQAEENMLEEDRMQDEKEAMKATNHGRAWLFVNKVLERHKRLRSSPKGHSLISEIAVDDMVFLAEKFLDCQSELQAAGSPSTVTLGYHYTQDRCMESIKQDGLMSLADRNERNINVRSHGAVFGDGIYTASNPFAFHNKYGEVGLLVAVILGKTRRVDSYCSRTLDLSSVNTVIGNKRLAGSRRNLMGTPHTSEPTENFDEIVLLQSCQCLPLMRFCSTMVSPTDDRNRGNESVWAYHREMQRVIDEFFNDGVGTKLHRILPSDVSSSSTPGVAAPNGLALSAAIQAQASVASAAAAASRASAAAAAAVAATGLAPGTAAPSSGDDPFEPTPLKSMIQRSHAKAAVVAAVQQRHPGVAQPAVAPTGLAATTSVPHSLTQLLACPASRNSGSSSSLKRAASAIVQPLPSPKKCCTVNNTGSHSSGVTLPRQQQPSQPQPQTQQQPQCAQHSVVGWQSHTDARLRRKMVSKILQALRRSKMNAPPPDWDAKLPLVAKRLEDMLYQSAPSLDSYRDRTTLRRRLRQVLLQLQKQMASSKGGAPPMPPSATAWGSGVLQVGTATPQPATPNVAVASSPPPIIPILSPAMSPKKKKSSGAPGVTCAPGVSNAGSSLPPPSSIDAQLQNLQNLQQQMKTLQQQQTTKQQAHLTTPPKIPSPLPPTSKVSNPPYAGGLVTSAAAASQVTDAAALNARAQQMQAAARKAAGLPPLPNLPLPCAALPSTLAGSMCSPCSAPTAAAPAPLPPQQCQQLLRQGLFQTPPPSPPAKGQAATLPARPPSPPRAARAITAAPALSIVTPLPVSGTQSTAVRAVTVPETIVYQAPSTLSSTTDAFQTIQKSTSKDDECAICIDLLCSPKEVVCLKGCRHEFHRECIEAALKRDSKCPVCRKVVGQPQGKSPSGEMRITITTSTCGGFEACGGSIVISYSLPAGVQMPYHDNPGALYFNTLRTAYLPDNEDGRRLLKRLKYAWTRGLTFTVGTSLTTRRPNSIIWSSIHHKTSQRGGPYGFPDSGFFLNCNEELDSLGVPSWDDL